MKISFDLTSEEAETILFALALRSKQKGLTTILAQEAEGLGYALNHVFQKEFKWSVCNRMKNNRRPIKHVTIKLYDLAPSE